MNFNKFKNFTNYKIILDIIRPKRHIFVFIVILSIINGFFSGFSILALFPVILSLLSGQQAPEGAIFNNLYHVIHAIPVQDPIIASCIFLFVICTLSLLIETGCDSVVTVHEIIHGHPYRAKKLLADSRLDNFFEGFNGDMFLQKQDRPPAYAYNGAVYLRKRWLLENYSGKDFGLGNDVRAVCMSPEDSVNIDTESDFRMAEFIMREIRGK